MTDSTSMSDKAMLATLTVRLWSASKHDKKVSAEVTEQKGATKKAGRFHKSLIAAEALDEVRSIAAEARTTMYSLTLPWASEGVRILPAPAFGRFEDAMAARKQTFDQRVAEFLGEYPERVEQARNDLGELFDASDYPTEHELARAFNFERRIWPFPETNDFRVAIGDDERRRIRTEIAAEQQKTLHRAALDLWNRAYEPVQKMAEKLAAYERGPDGKAVGIFRDTLVSNVAEIAELLPALNLAADPRLDEMAARIKSRLAQYTAQQLREDDGARAQVADEAARIGEEMRGWMEGIPAT